MSRHAVNSSRFRVICGSLATASSDAFRNSVLPLYFYSDAHTKSGLLESQKASPFPAQTSSASLLEEHVRCNSIYSTSAVSEMVLSSKNLKRAMKMQSSSSSASPDAHTDTDTDTGLDVDTENVQDGEGLEYDNVDAAGVASLPRVSAYKGTVHDSRVLELDGQLSNDTTDDVTDDATDAMDWSQYREEDADDKDDDDEDDEEDVPIRQFGRLRSGRGSPPLRPPSQASSPAWLLPSVERKDMMALREKLTGTFLVYPSKTDAGNFCLSVWNGEYVWTGMVVAW